MTKEIDIVQLRHKVQTQKDYGKYVQAAKDGKDSDLHLSDKHVSPLENKIYQEIKQKLGADGLSAADLDALAYVRHTIHTKIVGLDATVSTEVPIGDTLNPRQVEQHVKNIDLQNMRLEELHPTVDALSNYAFSKPTPGKSGGRPR